jgi:hypothetical protein
MLRQSCMAIAAHIRKIGQNQSRNAPFVHGKLGGANLNPILIVGGTIAQGCTACWVDFADGAVVLIHFDTPPIPTALRSFHRVGCQFATWISGFSGRISNFVEFSVF